MFVPLNYLFLNIFYESTNNRTNFSVLLNIFNFNEAKSKHNNGKYIRLGGNGKGR